VASLVTLVFLLGHDHCLSQGLAAFANAAEPFIRWYKAVPSVRKSVESCYRHNLIVFLGIVASP
jgi:hypothetical protein